MLRIRLRRTGKKNQPHYRIVVAEHTAPITGKYVGVVGHYNPRSKDMVIDDVAIMEWLNKGAQPSNTIAKLLQKQGLKHKSIKIHMYPERAGKNAPAEVKEVKTEKTEVVEETPAVDEQAPADEVESTTSEADAKPVEEGQTKE